MVKNRSPLFFLAIPLLSIATVHVERSKTDDMRILVDEIRVRRF
jgi:hypothetical protein